MGSRWRSNVDDLGGGVTKDLVGLDTSRRRWRRRELRVATRRSTTQRTHSSRIGETTAFASVRPTNTKTKDDGDFVCSSTRNRKFWMRSCSCKIELVQFVSTEAWFIFSSSKCSAKRSAEGRGCSVLKINALKETVKGQRMWTRKP